MTGYWPQIRNRLRNEEDSLPSPALNNNSGATPLPDLSQANSGEGGQGQGLPDLVVGTPAVGEPRGQDQVHVQVIHLSKGVQEKKRKFRV